MVSSMVRSGGVLADIGTDHAYVPISLVRQGKIQSAIAMDINEGPLERARENIQRFALQSRITCRLSDGFEALEAGESQSAVIAGMGGALMIRILEAKPEVIASQKELILQPQSELWRVRRYIKENGWWIDDEEMVQDAGKYYTAIHAVPSESVDEKDRGEKIVFTDLSSSLPSQIFEETIMYYGPVLISKKHPVLQDYLDWETHIQSQIRKNICSSPRPDHAKLLELGAGEARNRAARDMMK